MIFICAYLIVGVFAWLNGNPLNLLHPTDSSGRICGVDYSNLKLGNKTYLHYFDVTKCVQATAIISMQCPTTQICVASCPTEMWSWVIAEATATATSGSRQDKADAIDWNKFICKYGYNPKEKYIGGVGLNDMVKSDCASYVMPSSQVAGRCIPGVDAATASFNVAGEIIKDAENNDVTGSALSLGVKPIQAYLKAQDFFTVVLKDMSKSWATILILLAVAAVMSFLWIVLMRYVAGPMVWITLLGFLGLASFGVYYTFHEWQKLKSASTEASSESIISVGFTTDLTSYLKLEQTWLIFFIILAVVDLIILLIILFLRKRIQIAVEIIDQASKAVGSMMTTLFYPLVTFVLSIITLGFWVLTALFLASSGQPVYKFISETNATLNGQSCNGSSTEVLPAGVKCEFIEYGGESLFHKNVIWLQAIMLFGVIWIMNWILALGQCTLAGAYSSYYWAWNKPSDIPYFPLYSSFGRSLRFHTGSLAFGSFIIAVVQVIRIMLEYIDHKLKKSENKVAKFIMCCLKCCFWCLENFIKWLNRNAYIMVAIYGKNFCASAKDAFKLLMRNVLRAAVLDRIVDFVLLMGKLVVTLGMGALSWAFFSGELRRTISVKFQEPQLTYYYMPIVVVVLCTFVIASGFFNTFGMAADTIFLCFLEDLERNDGSPEKPYYMGKGLMKVLGKKNKKASNKKVD